MSTGINHDVRRLLEESIDSIRKLDVLLCMRDAGVDHGWTVAELNAKLRSSETALEADLSGLLDAQLVGSVAGPADVMALHTWRTGENRGFPGCVLSNASHGGDPAHHDPWWVIRTAIRRCVQDPAEGARRWLSSRTC